MSTRFEEILLEKGIITHDQLHIALTEQLKSQTFLSEILVDLRFVAPDIMGEFVSEFSGYPYIDLEHYPVDGELILKFGKEFCIQYEVVPFGVDNLLHVAMLDPENVIIQDIVRRASERFFEDKIVKFYCANKKALVHSLQRSIAHEKINASFEIDNLLSDAFSKQASDIHFVPLEKMIMVKFRIHGELVIYQHLELSVYEKICIRLKLLSKLDIAERRRPQSGGCKLSIQGSQIDCRVSFHPCSWGESLVVRLLPNNTNFLSLSELGFSKSQVKAMKRIVRQTHGLFLVCGPTGSGKTTTLHALLKELDSSEKNIMTLEQPIEYKVNGLRQTEIQEDGVVSFAEGVRSMLRHDPDVILIGEIRDEDTAKMALRASMTGHLVLATIHASCPFVTPSRLIDLGITPNLLSGQILAVLSQDLIKTKNGRIAKGELVEFNENMHLSIGDGAAKLRESYQRNL